MLIYYYPQLMFFSSFSFVARNSYVLQQNDKENIATIFQFYTVHKTFIILLHLADEMILFFLCVVIAAL